MKYNLQEPIRITLAVILLSSLFGFSSLEARQNWERDLRQVQNIPSLVTLESSPTHLYALSERDGLIVFRAYADSLQWLYSSEGMEQRGTRLQADARFAYLYGDTERLTIVEPTSVLGVYSSTELPAPPRSIQRLDNRIYIALGEHGLGSLSLESPEQLDSTPDRLLEQELNTMPVRDLVSDQIGRIYLLAGDRRLLVLQTDDREGPLVLVRDLELSRGTDRLFLTDEELIGSNSEGDIFLIDSNGQASTIVTISDPAERIGIWNDQLIVRSTRGRLWIGPIGGEPELWRENVESGNHFTITSGRLWVAEYNRIAPVVEASGDRSDASANTELQLRPISNSTIPYPRPVLIPLVLESGHDPTHIEFTYQSTIQNAVIRGQSFYWQPTSSQTGRHTFTITGATADGRSHSTEFSIEVRPFNTPPRFTPLQPVTINAEESFSLEITAFDPDGLDPDLIRYIGVDLPEGASINEQTGEFRWTPSIQQTGEHKFQVIATDQFGAASSGNVTVRVIEAAPEVEADLGIDD